MIRISDALQILRPGAEWSISDNLYNKIEWLDKTQTKPTEEEVNAGYQALRDKWIAEEYIRNRESEYPDWRKQLEYIYDNGVEKWKTDIVDPIKNKYPKPE